MLSIDSVPISHPFHETLNGLYWLMPGKGRLTLIGGLLTFVAGILIAHRTRFGANVFAIGGGVRTERLMGVPVGRTTVAIHALSGFLAGLSGIAFPIYTSAGYSLAIGGTLVGVLIMGPIRTYITFDGTLSSWWTKIVIGLLLLA